MKPSAGPLASGWKSRASPPAEREEERDGITPVL